MTRARHWAMVTAGAAGLSAALAGLWLASRAVIAVGGSCAEGGPYVVATACPDGVVAWTSAAVPAMFVFGALLAYGATRVHDGAWWLPLLGWPVLFLSLGWNFLEGALHGTGDTGGWVLCAVLFVLLGAPGLWGARWVARLARERLALVALVAAGAAGGVAFAAAFGPA